MSNAHFNFLFQTIFLAIIRWTNVIAEVQTPRLTNLTYVIFQCHMSYDTYERQTNRKRYWIRWIISCSTRMCFLELRVKVLHSNKCHISFKYDDLRSHKNSEKLWKISLLMSTWPSPLRAERRFHFSYENKKEFKFERLIFNIYHSLDPRGLSWQKFGDTVEDAQQWWWQFTSASQVPSWQHLQDSYLRWPSQWLHSPHLLQQVHTVYTKSKQRQGYQRKAEMDPQCYLHHFYWICISMLSFAESLYRFLQIHFQQHKHQIRSQFWPRQY